MSKAERMDPAESAEARGDPDTITVNSPVGEPVERWSPVDRGTSRLCVTYRIGGEWRRIIIEPKSERPQD